MRDELFRDASADAARAGRARGFRASRTSTTTLSCACTATVEPAERERREIATSRRAADRFTRFARAQFELAGAEQALDLYWLDGYGGGVFLSFADATSGTETYGGGRYLLDTVKGADLGEHDGRLVLDFNFAYNPSCAYDPRWVCPLAPPGNRLAVPVTAGERMPSAG